MIELKFYIGTLFTGGGVSFRIDNEQHCKQLDILSVRFRLSSIPHSDSKNKNITILSFD